jgi:hypothetical protein
VGRTVAEPTGWLPPAKCKCGGKREVVERVVLKYFQEQMPYGLFVTRPEETFYWRANHAHRLDRLRGVKAEKAVPYPALRDPRLMPHRRAHGREFHPPRITSLACAEGQRAN